MLRSAAAVLLALVLAAPARAGVDSFPRPNEIFPPLAADPRHIQTSASYYRLDGKSTSDLALGRSWGLTRWRSGELQDWLWEADVEAMAYSRFRVGGGVNEFETVDFLGDLPVTVRRGDVSFKGTLSHQSSHLGDDYIRGTGDAGFRYSTEGLRAQAAIEPWPFARFYGGGEWLIHAVPAFKRGALQAGLELTSGRLFLAEDVQWRRRVGWNADSHLVAGVELGAARLAAGWFDGHSPFGQFYARRTHYVDVSASLRY